MQDRYTRPAGIVKSGTRLGKQAAHQRIQPGASCSEYDGAPARHLLRATAHERRSAIGTRHTCMRSQLSVSMLTNGLTNPRMPLRRRARATRSRVKIATALAKSRQARWALGDASVPAIVTPKFRSGVDSKGRDVADVEGLYPGETSSCGKKSRMDEYRVSAHQNGLVSSTEDSTRKRRMI